MGTHKIEGNQSCKETKTNPDIKNSDNPKLITVINRNSNYTNQFAADFKDSWNLSKYLDIEFNIIIRQHFLIHCKPYE